MKPAHLKILHKQYGLAGLSVCVGMALTGSLLWALGGGEAEKPSEKGSQKTTPIETAHQRINPQEIWVEKLETEAKGAKESVELLEKKLKTLEEMILESIKQSAKKEEELEAARLEIQGLMSNKETTMQQDLPEEEKPFPSSQEAALSYPVSSMGIKKVVLNFSKTGRKSSTIKKTVDNTVPAGTFAQGILLAGVDASTSIQASADPRPVLVRLTDDGMLPRHVRSSLKDCHVLASAFGDLSSERVYMRLEKLSCTEIETGEIIENQVSGYISGEDGKAGMRGTIVDKAGEAVRNSLVGGFFAGMGNFMSAQQQRAVFPVSPFGQSSALSPQNMVGAGAAQGAGNALEKYAEFFIKRAEQLQPVIQIAAGRRVDVVFTQGVAIDASAVSKARGRVRENLIRQQVGLIEEGGHAAEGGDSLKEKNEGGEL